MAVAAGRPLSQQKWHAAYRRINEVKTLRLSLVSNDTPSIILTVNDLSTGLPVDISDGGTTATLKIRLLGEVDNKDEIVCTKLPGRLLANGTVDASAPYDTDGSGGRCVAICDATVFDAAGDYEAELELSFGGTTIVTPYQLLRITVRADFAA